MRRRHILIGVIISISITIGMACVSCWASLWLEEPEPIHPFPNGLPKQEIVFSTYHPQLANSQAPTLGFIYADGTGREEYSLTLYDGSRTMFGCKAPPTSQGGSPRWSRDGELLFSMRGIPPVVRVIDKQGRMYGAQCDTLNHSSLTFDLQGNILAPIYEHSRVYQDYQGYAVPGSVLVARHDLKNCRINGVFLLPISADPRVVDAIGENPDGWIVAEFYDFEARTPKILLYHPTQRAQKIFQGIHPAFSDDGEWLAYYRLDGSLTIRRVETDEEQPLIRVKGWQKERWDVDRGALSMPGWSPDSQWLVYNTPAGEMYKVNRESGQAFYLGMGWAPDWR